MTVIGTFPVQRLPWRGYDDPALPVGIWMASGTTVGDASGGSIRVRLAFTTENAPASGDIFNLEQLTSFSSVGATRTGFMTAVNLAPAPRLNVVDRLWSLVWNVMDPLGNIGLGQTLLDLPIMLGGRQSVAANPASIDVGFTNPTATDSLSVTGMGYVWEARSVLAEGGPQRPVRNLWG